LFINPTVGDGDISKCRPQLCGVVGASRKYWYLRTYHACYTGKSKQEISNAPKYTRNINWLSPTELIIRA